MSGYTAADAASDLSGSVDGGAIAIGSHVTSYHPTVPGHVLDRGVVILGPDSKGFAVIWADGKAAWRLVHWESLTLSSREDWRDIDCAAPIPRSPDPKAATE